MLSLSSKKSKIFLILLILLTIIIVILFTSIFILKSGFNKKADNSLTSIKPDVEKIIAKHGESINRSQIEGALKRINDPSLSESERYKALQDLVYFINTAYSAKHDPELRKYAFKLEDLANEKFSKFHQKGTFTIVCSDPQCGQEINSELLDIQKQFNESGIDEFYLNTINKNFETAAYTPDSDEDMKIYGFFLVIDQLFETNNSAASTSAERLIKFVDNKFSTNYFKEKEEMRKSIDVPVGEEYAL